MRGWRSPQHCPPSRSLVPLTPSEVLACHSQHTLAPLKDPGCVTSRPPTRAWRGSCSSAASVAPITGKYVRVLITTRAEEGARQSSVERWSWGVARSRTSGAAPVPGPDAPGRERRPSLGLGLLFLRQGVQNDSRVQGIICPLQPVSYPPAPRDLAGLCGLGLPPPCRLGSVSLWLHQCCYTTHSGPDSYPILLLLFTKLDVVCLLDICFPLLWQEPQCLFGIYPFPSLFLWSMWFQAELMS